MQRTGHPALPKATRNTSILSRQISVASLRATVWVWAVLAILILTFLFHIISFSIVSWGHISWPRIIDVGLWQECEQSFCSYFTVKELSDAHRTTQAFATLSLLLMFSSLLLTIVYIFYEELQRDGVTHLILLGIRGVTVLFLIITFSVWSAHWLTHFKYMGNVKGSTGAGFALEVVCFVFELISTVLLAADFMINIRRRPSGADH